MPGIHHDWGTAPYERIHQLQQRLVLARADDRIPNLLLTGQHTPVITLGRKTPEGAAYLVQERRDLKVSRRVMLGDTLDVDHVDAEYLDGVLTLRIPLRDSAKPRQVEVRRGEQAAIEVESNS